MPKTRAELVERVLKDLGALPVGQTANDEEEESVDDMIEPVVERLAAEDIYHVSDLSAIEDSAFPWLSIVVAWHCSPEFGGAEIPIPLEVAEMRLKVIQSSIPTYKILEVNAF